MKTKTLRFLFGLLLIIWLSACQVAETAPTTTLTAESTQTSIFSPPEETEEPGVQIVSLNLWLGNDLVTGYDDPAYALLKDRIDQFNSLNPGLNVSIRIKEIEGTGGILESLDTARDAAPLAAPDLIAADLHTLQSIQSMGLITPVYSADLPFENLNQYYPFSLEAVTEEETILALPFGADLLVMYTNPEVIEAIPASWSDVYKTPLTLAFAASNQEALFQVGLYQAIAGNLLDENGDLKLTEVSLVSLFDFFSQTRARGQTPYQISILEEDSAWEAFKDQTYSAVINWTSLSYGGDLNNYGISYPPTLSGNPALLANAWYWGITTLDQEKVEGVRALAEFLSDPEFLYEFGLESGLVPVQKNVFDFGADAKTTALLKELLLNARSIPEESVINSLGPKLAEYTIMILKNEISNEDAAQAILDWAAK